MSRGRGKDVSERSHYLHQAKEAETTDTTLRSVQLKCPLNYGRIFE